MNRKEMARGQCSCSKNARDVKENKRERFLRVSGKRMELIINDFRKLGNCASTATYEYTEDDIARIITELDGQVHRLTKKFLGEKAFRISDSDDTK